jgi:hypothetical protein
MFPGPGNRNNNHTTLLDDSLPIIQPDRQGKEEEDGSEVIFYSFLGVKTSTEPRNGELGFRLPHWHFVKKGEC